MRWGTHDEHRARLDIDRCFKLLVDHYGADTFQAPELRSAPLPTEPPDQLLKEALRLAAERFQITIPPTTELAYASTSEMGHIGGDARAGVDRWALDVQGDNATVRHASAGDGIWRIRVANSLRKSPNAVAVVVAHELAHCLLYRDRLPGGDEHLTDALVILAGYGPLILRHYPGYLHPKAVKYLMTLRSSLAAS